jgi:hypothetical protein
MNRNREIKKERRWRNYHENMAILKERDVEYRENLTNVSIFKPVRVEYFPHTGRWVYKKNTYFGGTHALLKFMDDVHAGRTPSIPEEQPRKQIDERYRVGPPLLNLLLWILGI